MSKDYVNQEVKKIIDDKSLSFPKNFAFAATWILGNFKGLNLKVLDVKESSSLSDYFVIASATNPKQAQSMAEEVMAQFKKNGQEVISCEGIKNADWILLDLGDILVHIFLETSRGNYDLDGLWGEAPLVEIPVSYYFSSPDEVTEGQETEKNYF